MNALPKKENGRSSVVRGIAVVLLAVPVVVWTGWLAGIPILRSALPGMTAMNPVTALCFAALGFALLTIHRAPALAAVFGALLLAQGSTRIALNAFGVDAGLDALLLRPLLDLEPIPNRMATPTAALFALLGLAVLALTTPIRSSSASQVLAALSAVGGAVWSIGYLFNSMPVDPVAASIPMALPTALLMVLGGIGLLVVAPHEGPLAVFASPRAPGVIARRLLVSCSIGTVGIGALRIAGEAHGLYTTVWGATYFTVGMIVMLVGAVWVTTALSDQAERRRLAAVEEAERSRLFVQDVLDRVPCILFVKDAEGHFVLANRATAEFAGEPASALVGRTSRTFDDAWDMRAVLGALADAEGTEDVEFSSTVSMSSPDGERVYRTKARRIGLPGNGGSGLLGLGLDVTELKRYERELSEARDVADRANHAKSVFLSRMSHELRTPLNSVLGFAQLLEMEELSERQRESLHFILRGGQHLLGLINDVIDISRVETGNLAISLEPVDPVEVVREAIQLIEPQAKSRGIGVHVRTECSQGCHAMSDRRRLTQVVLNVLSNAVKYNYEQGHISVFVGTRSEDRVEIRIEDTGPGIPADRLGRLFVPFDRLGAEQGAVEGTGLGLALSRALVEAMGGTLEVDPEAKQGCAMVISLVRCPGPANDLKNQEVELGTFGNGEAGRESTVLYIEDNLANVRLMEQILALRQSVRLLVAMQGRIGLDLARQHRPDLIMLDLHLPDIGGDEVLSLLRVDPDLKDIPVVVVSADATPGQVERLLAAGARKYVTKPLQVLDLIHIFDELIGQEPATHA